MSRQRTRNRYLSDKRICGRCFSDDEPFQYVDPIDPTAGLCEGCWDDINRSEDVYCQICHEMIDGDYKQCTECGKEACIQNKCCVLTGCQTTDGVCKKCIINYENELYQDDFELDDDDCNPRLLCSKCDKDIRPDLADGHLGLYLDDESCLCFLNISIPKKLCYSCLTETLSNI